MTKLFAELKRRHVYRVAIAYAVTAWLLLQLAAIVLPTFGAPGWVLKAVIGVFVLFFPIALIVAWAYELTPEGVRRTEPADSEAARPAAAGRRLGRTVDFAIIVVLAAAVGVLLWRQFGLHSRPAPAKIATQSAAAPGSAPAAALPAATAIPAKSIAVLPFENLSSDKANAYFAAGMREEILTRLANLGGLLVISSTSSSRFPSRPADLRTVARELGVVTVLEGSVQKAGNEVLVNVQLIDARTDNHLWAESYQRTLDDVFGVEGEVAQKVATALETRLTAAELQQFATPSTTNAKAYDAYLRGRAYESASKATASIPPLYKALAAYREAVTLDPEFAAAWARSANLDLGIFRFLNSSPQQLATAKQALDKAIALAPEAGETLLAQGYYYYYGLRDYPRALPAFERALPKLPNSAEALQAIADVERRQGHWQNALKHLDQALERDPLDADLLWDTGATYSARREFPTAITLFNRAIAISPGNLVAVTYKASAYQAMGNLAAAGEVLAAIDPASANDLTMPSLVDQKLFTRDYPGAIQLLRTALARHTTSVSSARARYHVDLGFAEQLAGDPAAARTAYAQARAELRAAIKASPDNPFLYDLLGQAEAGLGNEDAALAAGRHAVALLPTSQDAMSGPRYEEDLARIESGVGEHQAAITALHRLLSLSYDLPLTTALLRVDPSWDPLRKDPAFQALLAPP